MDCQVFGGSPYRAVVFCKGQYFKIKGKGKAKEYITTTPESGNKRIQVFYGEYGSKLYGCNLARSGYNVRIGCMDQRDSLSPVKHIFGTSAQKWVHNLNRCPCSKEVLTAKPSDIYVKQFVKIYKHLRQAFLGVNIDR